ncbi:Integral membrane protein [Penicillium digitatum]|uniref:Integral membrane protein n=3 Tax=Penicillium digitatum TaxID=36651 RepID=K9G5L2_PEND2|nr:Integral membrane protein [Penicillium digitatum Pd1]EKV08481.1 Integral membrane protein [Penicillium digitatum Pd1]EKV10133.1 Integral membrane protein [Penicillium digitatum PHI26]QQK41805.1 Integral membrane protein [Penicillium digitatum]
MRRRSHFQTGRKPLGHHGFKLDETHVTGPVPFLNPTSALYEPTQQRENTHAFPRIERLWRSRDNRKGRHAVRVDTEALPLEMGLKAPRLTRSIPAVVQIFLQMVTYVPYWDVSYLVAMSFTVGSAVFIVNGFFVWLPLVNKRTEFHGEITVAGGWTAFVGATIFEVGGVLLLLEAFNTNHTGCFGWALESVLEKTIEDGISHRAVNELRPVASKCEHHHANRKSFLRENHYHASDNAHSQRDKTGFVTSSTDGRLFRWIPSMSELRTHFFHEIGFLSSFILFVSATIFWVGAIVGIPCIFNHMSKGLIYGLYWGTTTLGGVGFTLSSLLSMLETQSKWYLPAWHVLGWHIGLWNLIGSVGFTLCAALGPASSHSGVNYESSLATFWGSIAFTIGSMIQWYESLQKHPVEKK